MENFSWLNGFKEIGARVSADMGELFKGTGAGRALGKGAGGDTTLVLDKRAEDAIISVLDIIHASGQNFTFVSEEMGEKVFGRDNLLVLADPVDGSNNAKYGLPIYSTSLALASGRKLSDVTLGYIINLATGDEFWAVKGQGAFKNGMRIKTSDHLELGVVNFEASIPKKHMAGAMGLLTAAKKIRCIGSTALDLAYLSCGATDAVVVPFPSRSFDYAAGWLILHEAGGIMTDTEGNPLDDSPLGLERTKAFIAAGNRPLLEKALSAYNGGVL
ncbi:MAG TPA: inositol monophosphatase family protein [Nitrospirota bacterium]|jgi:myo-inositol-1(or 4)-monophosphatase